MDWKTIYQDKRWRTRILLAASVFFLLILALLCLNIFPKVSEGDDADLGGYWGGYDSDIIGYYHQDTLHNLLGKELSSLLLECTSDFVLSETEKNSSPNENGQIEEKAAYYTATIDETSVRRIAQGAASKTYSVNFEISDGREYNLKAKHVSENYAMIYTISLIENISTGTAYFCASDPEYYPAGKEWAEQELHLDFSKIQNTAQDGAASGGQ